MTYKIICVLIVSVLVSCQTSYRAKSILDGLGYQDKELQEGVYQIAYKVNAMTKEQVALDLWHTRASELCGHTNYFADASLTRMATARFNPSNAAYYSHISSNSEALDPSDPRKPASLGSLYSSNTENISSRVRSKRTEFPEAIGVAYCAGKPEALLTLKPSKMACSLYQHMNTSPRFKAVVYGVKNVDKAQRKPEIIEDSIKFSACEKI